jgi:hypothetical protein
MSLHSNESKREEYHRYLEKSGVIEYFTRVLVDLYEIPEKPLDPNEFIREQLSKFFPDDTDDLRQQIQHHEEMLMERENVLRDLQQEQYELRTALEAKGIQFHEIDFAAEYSTSERHTSGGSDDDDDDDDDRHTNSFGFGSDYIPVFKYHQTTQEELEHHHGLERDRSHLSTINQKRSKKDDEEGDDENKKDKSDDDNDQGRKTNDDQND